MNQLDAVPPFPQGTQTEAKGTRKRLASEYRRYAVSQASHKKLALLSVNVIFHQKKRTHL